jgi:hypothetical protein
MPKKKKNIPWKEAIIHVLAKAGNALRSEEIADEVGRLKLRTNLGATPNNTVHSIVSQSIKIDGGSSPFVKTGLSEFSLRDAGLPDSAPQASGAPKVEFESASPTGLIQAFGMYWSRADVSWKVSPKLLGQQNPDSTAVDFNEQRGVYLLHDGREVMYVGRTIDRSLGRRLNEHLTDRLRGRWDRFSWFGLRPVDNSGRLGPYQAKLVEEAEIIAIMEALLIEGLEPRQNRKRGDDFRAVEYIQARDPDLERARKQELLDDLRKRI